MAERETMKLWDLVAIAAQIVEVISAIMAFISVIWLDDFVAGIWFLLVAIWLFLLRHERMMKP